MSFKYTDNGKTTKSVGGSTTPQKVGDTLFLYRRSMLYIPFQQNAYKVPETKREVRRRTTQNAEKVSETKKEGRRRTSATSRPPDEVYDAFSAFCPSLD